MSVLRKIRHVEEHREDDTELWMLPFSTLMLTLVILFIAFYALSINNAIEFEATISSLAASGNSADADRLQQEIALARSMQDYITANKLTGVAHLTVSAQFIKLKMESPVLFASGSAVLKQDGIPLLSHLAGQLKTMKNRVIVEGHTDSTPIHSDRYRSNWELSAARSFSVIYHLIEKKIDRERLVAHGYGEFRPAFKNDTEEGRARNRRIEITVVREGTQP